MPHFRKRPVVIEARQFAGNHPRLDLDLAKWCGGALRFRDQAQPGAAPRPFVVIPTLEGDHEASPGDWIIRGIRGEFYPCKPDIFAATYEPADEA